VNEVTSDVATPLASRSRTARRRTWLAGSGALAVLALLAVVSLHDGARLGAPAVGAATADAAADAVAARSGTARRIPGDPLALGMLTAPVVVAEWGDFQCPFCRAFDEDTQPALSSQYVSTGQVRFEWHDLPKIGPESVLAARAARAAGRQGAFWRLHDVLYREQAAENSGALTEASLTAMARGLGLDADRFARDLADPTIAAAVDQDQHEAARLGITHVPSFLVNGGALFGAQPLATFRQAIDAALTEAH
jgi:protein-disulfide isomerase